MVVSSNVDNIKDNCQQACATRHSYEYNSYNWDIVFADKSKAKATCKELEGTRSSGCLINGQTISEVIVDNQKNCKVGWTSGVCKYVEKDITDIVKEQKCKETNTNTWANNKCTSSTSADLTLTVTEADCNKVSATWVGVIKAPIITEACNNI